MPAAWIVRVISDKRRAPMRQLGTDHILFGSDWPFDTPADAIAAVRKLGPTTKEQQQVLHDNAVNLLGLEP
jgi:uncharacterized protein